MVNESNKIIVKVGKKSRVQLTNSKVYRAITANDLVTLTNKFNDCHIVIIESIDEDEQEAVKDFAVNFKKVDESNTVLFFIPDNDDITSGIADELDYNIYLTLSELYKYIYETFGINTSIYLEDKKRLNSEELTESIPEGVTDIFGGIGEQSETDISEAIKQIDDEDKAEGLEKETTTVQDNNTENIRVSLSKEEDDNNNLVNEQIESDNKTNREFIENNDQNVDNASEINIEQEINEFEQSVNNDINNANDDFNIDDEEDKQLEANSETQDYIDELKMKLRDAKYDYSVILKDMREANSKIDSLENVIRILKEEKEEVEKRFDDISISEDILEDPISLSQYQEIEDNAKTLGQTVEEQKVTIKSLKSTIENKEKDINEYNETIKDLRDQLNSLHNSIDSGEIHKEVIEEYTEKLNSITEDKNNALEKVESLKTENNDIQAKLHETTERAEAEADARIEMLSKFELTIQKINELSNKLTKASSEKDDLETKLKDTEEQVIGNKKKIDAYESTIKELNNTISGNNKTAATDNKTITELNKKIVSLTESLNNSEQTVNNQLEEIKELKNKLEITDKRIELSTNYSIDESNKLKAQINNLQSELDNYKNKFRSSENNVSKLKNTIETLKSDKKQLEQNVNRVENEKKQLEAKTLNSNQVEYDNSQIQVDNIAIEAERQQMKANMLALESEKQQLEMKLKSTEDKLQQKEKEIVKLESSSGNSESKLKTLLDTNNTLENVSKTLKEQLDMTNNELDISRKKEEQALQQIEQYKRQVELLQNNHNIQNSYNTTQVSENDISIGQINYIGNSQIISVIGSGSFGITTTAMSLANKLAPTSQVLYVDFDLVSPMADAWFKKNPMIQNIQGTKVGNVQNSGLGIFFEYGMAVFGQNISKIIKSVNKTKGGSLNYLSGVYYTPNVSKLANADYGALFNILSSKYQYIICDFGRLGSNKINDQIIKAITDISYRIITVTTTNQFEIRNFKAKINNSNIDTSKMDWLLNMCISTALDNKVKELISPCKYELIPRMEQYSSQDTFLRNNVTRDRFAIFIDKKVFGR